MGWNDVFSNFGAFVANSYGSDEQLVEIAKQSIKEIFPALNDFIKLIASDNAGKVAFVNPFIISQMNDNNSQQYVDVLSELNYLFEHYKSDKSLNKYSNFYASIVDKSFGNILEIGLGTNYEDVVSSMGKNASPGASLRAFRDYLANSNCYGADVDQRILFTEERIETFYVDQMSQQSLRELSAKLPESFDLIIDDGLHCILANLNTLIFALPKIRVGGWFVIEDLFDKSYEFWQIISSLLPKDQYHSLLYFSKEDIYDIDNSILWAVKRIK